MCIELTLKLKVFSIFKIWTGNKNNKCLANKSLAISSPLNKSIQKHTPCMNNKSKSVSHC